MAVQKSRKSRSKRDMRRSHDSLSGPTCSVDTTSGSKHLRHHISKDGFFAANLYSESFIYGKKLTALMNLRLYPEGFTNEEANMLYSQNDIVKMDEIALSNMNDIFLTSVKMGLGDRLLEWKGTKKETINDKYYLVCNYIRESMHDNTNKFNVKLYKLFDEKKSLTLTVSYKDITRLQHKMESVRNDIANSLKFKK